MKILELIDWRYWVLLGCVVLGVLIYAITRQTDPHSEDSYTDAWSLFKGSLRVLYKQPAFAAPIGMVWVFYASVILGAKYYIPWHQLTITQVLITVFLEIFLLSYFILAGCSVMLEMIRQLEFAEELSFSKAIVRWVQQDMLRIIPLAFVWAIFWFILTVIQVLTSKSRRSSDSDSKADVADAARTLANIQEFSWSGITLEALQKAGRMVVFLILPPMIWERAGFMMSVKKGLGALRGHIQTFVAGYSLTYATTGIIFLPVILVIEAGTSHKGTPPLFNYPSWVWVATIVYIGLSWSFSMYLEQMFMANLYNLQMNWVNAASAARASGENIPLFRQKPLSRLLGLPELQVDEDPTLKKISPPADLAPTSLPPLD